MRPHVAKVGTKIGKLLPTVTRHAGHQRSLAVHNLVVGDGQDEVLAIGVRHGERHVVVMVLTINRFALHVSEGVMHPAHVPLKSEAKATEIGGTCDTRPRGGFLRDGHDSGHALIDGGVHFLEEGDRVQILPAAKSVGGPLALFP